MLGNHEAFVGSFAMVRRHTDHGEQWLTVWDEHRKTFRLIESRREPPHTFRTCLDDAIEEDLELDRKRDYLVSGYSSAHHQAPIEWPGIDQPQWVVVEFFPVDLYSKRAAGMVEELPHVRWFTLSEIAKGSSADGDKFCPLQHLLIHRADILPPRYR
jgi:hypothetical protein